MDLQRCFLSPFPTTPDSWPSPPPFQPICWPGVFPCRVIAEASGHIVEDGTTASISSSTADYPLSSPGEVVWTGKTGTLAGLWNQNQKMDTCLFMPVWSHSTMLWCLFHHQSIRMTGSGLLGPCFLVLLNWVDFFSNFYIQVGEKPVCLSTRATIGTEWNLRNCARIFWPLARNLLLFLIHTGCQ